MPIEKTVRFTVSEADQVMLDRLRGFATDNRDRREIDENSFLVMCLQAGFCRYQERYLTSFLQAIDESIEHVNYSYQTARKEGFFETVNADGTPRNDNRAQHPQVLFTDAARRARERGK